MYLHDAPDLPFMKPPVIRLRRHHPARKRHPGMVRRHRLVMTPHAGGDLNEFYDGQLGGFGSKLKKAVRKVAKVAAVGAALYFAPTLAVSALKAVQARKQAEAQAKAQAEANARAQAEAATATAQAIQQAQQSSVATAASPMALTPSIAPPAGLVAQTQNIPTMTSFAPSGGSPSYEPIPGAGTPPSWVKPAAIAGAGLLAILLLRPKSA